MRELSALQKEAIENSYRLITECVEILASDLVDSQEGKNLSEEFKLLCEFHAEIVELRKKYEKLWKR